MKFKRLGREVWFLQILQFNLEPDSIYMLASCSRHDIFSWKRKN